MRMGTGLSSLCKTTVAALALLAAGALSAPSYAQVKPGDFITPENADKVKDLVAPGVYYKVQKGMSMKITHERVDWPPPYKDATESTPLRSGSRRTIGAWSVTWRDSLSR